MLPWIGSFWHEYAPVASVLWAKQGEGAALLSPSMRADRLQGTGGNNEVLLCWCNSLGVVERKCFDDKGRVSQRPEGTFFML